MKRIEKKLMKKKIDDIKRNVDKLNYIWNSFNCCCIWIVYIRKAGTTNGNNSYAYIQRMRWSTELQLDKTSRMKLKQIHARENWSNIHVH